MSESILLGYGEVSELLGGIPINTLKDYRAKGKGPRSAVIGGRVKYRRSDVYEWLDEQFSASCPNPTRPPFTPLGKRTMVVA